jgi:chaperone BCS1
MASKSDFPDTSGLNPQTALLDAFFPGFSIFSSALYKYSKIDLSLYIPMMLAVGLIVFASQYFNTWFWEFADLHLMSTADIRVDDEMYNSEYSRATSRFE